MLLYLIHMICFLMVLLDSFTAVGLVSFATGGAQVVAELGGEMKRPYRDIPIVIVVATIFVGLLYAFIASIAVGVLPISRSSGSAVNECSTNRLPRPIFIFFIVGGAMFALATTLNSTLTWVTKSLLVAIQDGYLPSQLGAVNKRFGTPLVAHIILYYRCFSHYYRYVINSCSTIRHRYFVASVRLPALAVLRLPKRYPEAYQRSPLKVLTHY